jgi:hypothetical protein
MSIGLEDTTADVYTIALSYVPFVVPARLRGSFTGSDNIIKADLDRINSAIGKEEFAGTKFERYYIVHPIDARKPAVLVARVGTEEKVELPPLVTPQIKKVFRKSEITQFQAGGGSPEYARARVCVEAVGDNGRMIRSTFLLVDDPPRYARTQLPSIESWDDRETKVCANLLIHNDDRGRAEGWRGHLEMMEAYRIPG